MFSLIITIVAIVLVALLALATIYYGADALSKGNDRVVVTQILSEGQQIQGALSLYEAEHGHRLTDISAAAPDYLKKVPTNWVFRDDFIYYKVTDSSQCDTANGLAGASGEAPLCSELWADPSEATVDKAGTCCRLDSAALAPVGQSSTPQN